MCAAVLPLLLQRDLNGKTYYEFEYTAKNNRYTRHSLAVVVANDGEADIRGAAAWGLQAAGRTAVAARRSNAPHTSRSPQGQIAGWPQHGCPECAMLC